MYFLLVWIVKIVGLVFRAVSLDRFDLTNLIIDLYKKDTRAEARGFVLESDGEAVGVYIVRFYSSLDDNDRGRWN